MVILLVFFGRYSCERVNELKREIYNFGFSRGNKQYCMEFFRSKDLRKTTQKHGWQSLKKCTNEIILKKNMV
jgi:hypothetical protein